VRLWRGLSKRILVASIACGLLGLFGTYALTITTTRDVVLRNTVPVWIYTWREHERARCEASPETWTASAMEGTHSWAYDPATGLSRNAFAPPLDARLVALVPPDGDRALRLNGFMRGGAAVFRAGAGPCGLVVTTWTARATVRDVLPVLLLMILLAATVAAAIGLVAVVRPVTLRIDRLKRAAERVGEPHLYASAERHPGEDELGELSASLDRAHDRIRADAAKLEQRQADLRRHLDDVTHDLRTPIASLLLALEQAADAASDRMQREILVGALKDAVYLGALTANLRLASQLREGWSPVAPQEPADLTDTVERVATRARILARRSGIELDVAVPDGPVLVACDRVAAEQAIGNVVDNAVAYGDRGGHVAVVLERESDGFSLRVEDDGPGVRESELPRLGVRTFRSDEARARDPRGSGLGLAITNEVCERCGWKLAFGRGEARGLVVTVRGAMSRG
jgi:signal transduction histidine kinase